MIIKWLGHSSFKIRFKDKIIYIDPYSGEYNEIADLILITHSHSDHFSLDIIKKITNDDTIVVGTSDVISEIAGKVLKNGEKIDLGFIVVEAVPAYNINKKFHPRGFGNGYILTINKIKIYHCGDTDLIPEMNLISADLVLIPVGGTYTMDSHEAIKAIKIISPKLAIPMHWGNIVGHIEDAEHFKEGVESKTNTKVSVLQVGEELDL